VCFSANREVDSDGDEMPDEDEEIRQFYGYRVWYALEVHVKPAAPERVIEVTCNCQKRQLLEVGRGLGWFFLMFGCIVS